jgi:hypothetical protein
VIITSVMTPRDDLGDIKRPCLRPGYHTSALGRCSLATAAH